MTAAARSPIGVVRDDPAMLETCSGARSRGGRRSPARGRRRARRWWTEQHMDFMAGLPAEMTSSQAHDLAAGKALEVDGLSGAVVRLGREAGVDTPVHATLHAVLRPFAQGRAAVLLIRLVLVVDGCFGAGRALSGLCAVDHHAPRAAGCARRAQARASAHALRHAAAAARSRLRVQEMRPRRRRRDGQIPSPRRPGDLRRAGAARPGFRGRAIRWSTGRAISAISTATTPPPCATPRRA
jgi:hypothetical protein